MQNHDELLQVQGCMFNLANQVEQMQWVIARLLQETQASNSKMNALIRHIINSETQTRLHEKLAEFVTQLDTNQEKLDDLSEPQRRIHEKLTGFITYAESSKEKLDELAKTVKKLSRTQFKANALSESKEQHVSETLSLLRDLATKREELKESQKSEEQRAIPDLQAKAQSELAADFLPVLDGIERALAHSAPLPAQKMPHGQPDAPAGFFRKMFTSSAHAPESHAEENPQSLSQEIHTTIAGWLRGLEIVRDRFISLLEREGIEQIPDLHERFDPHLHVAVDTEKRTDVAENTIISVIRKGYAYKDRVLRYSEVIVAKAPKEGLETINENFLTIEEPEKL